jgi:hypothetical protein
MNHRGGGGIAGGVSYTKMTYIQDIPEGPNRERLRAEILGNLDKRREDAHNALTEYIKYMGIVLSGGTIAILGFIASDSGGGGSGGTPTPYSSPQPSTSSALTPDARDYVDRMAGAGYSAEQISGGLARRLAPRRRCEDAKPSRHPR